MGESQFEELYGFFFYKLPFRKRSVVVERKGLYIYIYISIFEECIMRYKINPLAYTDVPETAGLARSINP